MHSDLFALNHKRQTDTEPEQPLESCSWPTGTFSTQKKKPASYPAMLKTSLNCKPFHTEGHYTVKH